MGNNHGMGTTFYFIGMIYYYTGNYDKALNYFNRALKIFKKLGEKGYSLFFGVLYYSKGEYDNALAIYIPALKLAEELGDKNSKGGVLWLIGMVYLETGEYNKAKEYLDKSLAINKEIDRGAASLLRRTIYVFLSYKKLGKEYDEKKIIALIKEVKHKENIEYYFNYHIYQLLEDTFYLETAYNQIQELADNLEPDVAAKFLSYPIPAAIVEEWEKVK